MTDKKTKHPDQPLEKVGAVVRFKENRLVSELLDQYPGGLNALVMKMHVDRKACSREDWEQLYQLMGYSVGGYCDLSQVSDESKDRHWAAMMEMAQKEKTG